MDAMPGMLLFHPPPAVALDNDVVNPRHISISPSIGAGKGLTVIPVVIRQPVV